MSGARRAAGPAEPLRPIPQELAAIMWPELPSLFQEMSAEIIGALPEYSHILDGPYGHAIRIGIEQNIATFVDQIAAPSTTSTLRDDMCRRFGRFEAYEGRSLDSLQAAYRIGARVGLRRAMKVSERYNLPPSVMMTFADSLFAYVGELASLSREGYLEAMSELGEKPDNRRRRVLRLILATPSVSPAAIAELAEHAAWPLPDEVTLVALGPESRLTRAALDRDVLVDLSGPEPHLLVPGPLDDTRRAALDTALLGSRAAVGLTTPLADAADSLRWARQTLALADAGIIDGRPVVRCEDHLLPLWLLGDPSLINQLSKKHLGPLVGLTPTQRTRLVDTLRTWLTTRGTAAQMAELLEVHPQTVRYRMRILDRAFGDQLADPDARFATEIVLRALHLQERAGPSGVPGRPSGGHEPF
ncbi:helix-turn-helix domain-containing protein [Streptomyces sp. H39-S7]|uniref:PucR family transcriptional regulator n=1 Tax=Streptomyces sp. H39-S7 TaxID=3004357 RepID=UPI0022AF3693|nr:PucR family transcriptional regulator [Streptomyces sp. H39-S7]MCZ4117987.1 helix-turn-helix domain-containing protein [Streptomyces sp. H39-S7]